jgi:hypothetical protein
MVGKPWCCWGWRVFGHEFRPALRVDPGRNLELVEIAGGTMAKVRHDLAHEHEEERGLRVTSGHCQEIKD